MLLLLLLFCFAASCIYHFICIINTPILFPLGFENNYPIASLIFLWELTPACLIFILFWKVPQKLLVTQPIVHFENIRATADSTVRNASMLFMKYEDHEKPTSTSLFPASYVDDYGSFTE